MDDIRADLNDLRKLVENFIPVRVVATTIARTDRLIGDFPSGVVMNGLNLVDIASSLNIATFSPITKMWEIRGVPYRYIFIQVKPQDAS